MVQEPAPVEDSVHLPDRLVGGGATAGVSFAAFSTAGLSVVQQPASSAADIKTGSKAGILA
jgi:hypothetical protein